jgi:hypothetical protein
MTVKAFVATLVLVALPGLAWSQTAQQERMKSCNAQAGKKELKGDERKAFMSDCLKGGKDVTAQQERMKTCNAQAGQKALKGDERKAFMSRCLSGKSAATGRTAQQR